MLSYANRFHGHSSLRYVFKNGATIRSRHFTLRVSPNSHRHESRFSVSISKKVLKSAVKRNRVRRRIYEIVRLSLPETKAAHDVVFIVATSEVLALEQSAMREAVLKPLYEAGVLK